MTRFWDDVSTARVAFIGSPCPLCRRQALQLTRPEGPPRICAGCVDLPPVVPRDFRFDLNGDVRVRFYLDCRYDGRSMEVVVTRRAVDMLLERFRASRQWLAIRSAYDFAGIFVALVARPEPISRRRMCAIVAQHVRVADGLRLRWPLLSPTPNPRSAP